MCQASTDRHAFYIIWVYDVADEKNGGLGGEMQ